MKLLEEIKLSNGLTLQIFDLSRTIAEDTVKVELSMQMKISLEIAFFAGADDYDQVKNIFGDTLTYSSRAERTFVPKESEEAVRKELIGTFKDNLLNYLSTADFAKKLALSLLRDIRKNPYKYQSRACAIAEE